MNATKHLLASLRNTVLERLPPIPYEIFYGTPSKKNDTDPSQVKSSKKRQSFMNVQRKFKLSRRRKRKAAAESSAVDTLPVKKRKREAKSAIVESAVNQQVQISTRGKKVKTPLKSAEIVTTAVKQEMQIGTQEKKRKSQSKLTAVNETNDGQNVCHGRKRKILLKLAEVVETAVKQEMQIETREKKRKSPLKLAAVDGVEQNAEAEKEKSKKSPLKSTKVVIVDQSVQNSTRGRKRRSKSEIKTAADVGQSAKGKKSKSPLKTTAVGATNVGQNAEVKKEKERKSPLKNAAIGKPNIGSNAKRRGRKKKLSLKLAEIDTTGAVQSVQISTRGRMRKYLSKTVADVAQSAEAEKREKSKSPLKAAGVPNVGPNATRQGRKKKLSLKPAEIDTTGAVQSVQISTRGRKRKYLSKTVADVAQSAEAEKREKSKSPLKAAGVPNVGPNATRQGRKRKLSLKPAEIDTTGAIQSVQISTRGRNRKSLSKTVADVWQNEKAGKEMKKKSPAKTVTSHDLDMNAEDEKEKSTTTTKTNTRQGSQVKSAKIASPAQSPLKKQTGTINSPARKKLFVKSQIDMNRHGKTAGGRVKIAVQRMKTGKCGPIINVKIEKTQTDEFADLDQEEKILSPSKKMPKMSEVPTTTVTSGAVRKLSWDFSIPAKSKESPRSYKLRKRMVKKIVNSTAPRMLRKETSGGGTLVKNEPEEVNGDVDLEEQGSAGLEQNETEPPEVESAVGCNTEPDGVNADVDLEEQESAGLEQNETEPPEVESAVGCNTEEEHNEEQPQVPPSENNQELPECSVDLVDCLVKSHNGEEYQPRKQKDPLKPKKYRFKKLPPEVKPEPLIDYEFEVTDEVDALSLDEIVIPDALPYEFDLQAVPMPSSSHHEDVYEALPMASSSQYKDTEGGKLLEDSDLEDKVKSVPVKRTYAKKKKNQPPSQVYNLRKKKTQQLPENKQVEETYEVGDYDVLNTRVLLTKKPGRNYWC